MLISTLSVNWVIDTPSEIISRLAAHSIPLDYNGFSCALSSKCVSSSRGMLAGCYPLEAILQSTIECFYKKHCIDQVNDFKGINISTLASSRFPMNTTIESVVNELMVEELTSNISYKFYFNQCASLSCVYSYVDNNNAIEGITILISLYGGLVIICRLIAIIIVRHILCIKQRITPTTD